MALLAGKGKVVGDTRVNVARVGVGVVVKEGATMPDVSNVDAFKKALLGAKTVAYIDPASGGSSGAAAAGARSPPGSRRRRSSPQSAPTHPSPVPTPA